jgi:streptogramin lyase
MSSVKSRRGRSNRAHTRRNHGQPRLESLESRMLMSGIVSYATPAFAPPAITADNAGNLWMIDSSGLYKLDANGQTTAGPLLTGVVSGDIAFGNDHIYLADQQTWSILEVDPTNGSYVSYPASLDGSRTPTHLTVANDGSVWFGVSNGDTSVPNFPSEIGRLDVTSGDMTFASVPDGGVIPFSLTAAPDGSVWFVGMPQPTAEFELSVGANVGHAHAATDGSVVIDNMYAISTPGSLPTGLTVADDGNIWFAVAYNGDQFAGDGPDRLVHGVLSGSTLVQTEYTIPEPTGAGGPADVALDDSGRLWFTLFNSNQLGYMDTATGDFTLMAVPASAAGPAGILVTGTDVWATAAGGGSDTLLQVDLGSFVPPVISTSPNFDATVDEAFSGSIMVFVGEGDTGSISYTIDFGDGQTASGTATSSDGMYTIPANVTYDEIGTYATSVTVVSGGNSVTMNGTAVVTSGDTETVVGNGIDLTGSQNVPLAPNRTIEGSPVLAVATFSGPVAEYSAVITWGDNTTSTGLIVDLGGGMYAVVVEESKVYAADGTYNGSVTISGGPNELTVGFIAEISDTPLATSNGVQLQGLQGRHFNGTVATFSDDINSQTSWFIATINWGDGGTSTGIVVADSSNPGSYIVIGQHHYKGKKATYTVETLITNTVENSSVTATGTIQM